MIRTYHHKSFSNLSKVNTLKEVGMAYRDFYNYLIEQKIKYFMHTNKIDKYLTKENLFAPSLFTYYASPLSERYKQNVNTEAKSTLESMLSNIENKIIDAIMTSSIKKDDRIKLFYINKYHAWFKKDVFMQGKRIEDKYLKLSRQLFKRYLSIPKRKSLTMILDQKVAVPSIKKNIVKKKAGAKLFDNWLTVSTLIPRKQVTIPFNDSSYAKKKNGTNKNAVQILFNEKNEITIGVIKDLKEPLNAIKKGIISIDVGLKHIIIQNDGTKHGSSLLDKIKKLDSQIINCMHGLQTRKISTKKGSSKRLDNFLKRLSALIKNEVGRAVNDVINQNPEMIVMEDLTDLTYDLTLCNFSKKLKRLISNSAMAKVNSLMEMRCIEKGITLKKINRAYTSQECYECFHTERDNRKGDIFHCIRCGHKDNADVNAAKIIDRRSSLDLFSKYTKFKEIKIYLNEVSDLFYKNGAHSVPINSILDKKFEEIRASVKSRLINP